MTVIGIDTAARVGGVSIVTEGRFLGSQVFGIDEGHSEYVVPALESLMQTLGLENSAVDGIAVSAGPGSFTGLRIGLTVAKSLSYAWQIPLVGVSTLAATAWTFRGVDAVVCACLDARRQSVYRGIFEMDKMSDEWDMAKSLVREEARVNVSEVAGELDPFVKEGRHIIVVGDGAPVLMDVISEQGLSRAVTTVPMAGEPHRPVNVAHLGGLYLRQGKQDDPFTIVPNYLRRSEAERLWKQRHS